MIVFWRCCVKTEISEFFTGNLNWIDKDGAKSALILDKLYATTISDNYTLVSDILVGKYDNLYIYGIGMIDVEFPMDVYTKP